MGPSGSNANEPSQNSGEAMDPSSSYTSQSADADEEQMSAEDVLVQCMLQMAQARSTVSAPTAPSFSPAVPAHSLTTAAGTAVSHTNTDVTTTPSAAAPVSNSSGTQRESKSAKLLESANSMFSRGNFAPVDHIPHPHTLTSSSSSPHPQPKFHTKGKTTNASSTATSGTVTSSSCTMTSSTSPPPHSHSATFATNTAAAFTNADISRLIPHLEAIAGSLQNSPALETHCLAALAQSHLLPALAQYDPDTPQAAELLEALQNLPLLTADGKTIPLANTATIDSASFLAGLDMNALMQNLASPELQGATPATDVQAQPVYPADFGSLKRLSQKMQAAAVVESSMDQATGGGGGGGQRFETDVLPNRTRPLTTSFLLDHNFPMDIPPPTDLLPEHVRIQLQL